MSLSYDYCPGTETLCQSNNGNVVSQVIGQAGSATQAFTYDAVGRLLTVVEGTTTWSRTCGYDRQANQWVSAWTGISPSSFTPQGPGNFNSKVQLVIQGSHYDDAGSQDVIGGYGMTYDEEGRLATMTYDGEGRRVKKQDGDVRTMVMGYGTLFGP